jgi:hypothetical protein
MSETEQESVDDARVRYLRRLAENARAEIAAIEARPPNLMTPAERRSAIRTQEQTLANIRSQLAALGVQEPEDGTAPGWG